MKITIKSLLKSRYTNWRTKDDSRFYDLRNESSMNVVCFFILLTRELENELDLSLYSLSSKNNRYAQFGDNQLTVYGIRLAAFVIVKAKIWILEYLPCRFSYPVSRFWNPDSRLWNSDRRLCSRSLLPKIRMAACYSNCYSELFSKITI